MVFAHPCAECSPSILQNSPHPLGSFNKKGIRDAAMPYVCEYTSAPLTLKLARNLPGHLLKMVFEFLLGTVSSARDDQRQRPIRIGHPEMQRREPAHREADDVGTGDVEVAHHIPDVVNRACLRVFRHLFRHVRGGITAGVEGHATVAARKVPNLRPPAALVPTELVDENNRSALGGIFYVQAHSIVGDSELSHLAPVI